VADGNSLINDGDDLLEMMVLQDVLRGQTVYDAGALRWCTS